jgi:hypothetical protein
MVKAARRVVATPKTIVAGLGVSARLTQAAVEQVAVPLGDAVSRYYQRYLRGCDGKYTCSWEIHLVVVAEPEIDFREKRRPNRVKKVD